MLGFPWAVVQKFGNDQAGSKAALLAYYGLFAVFPLLLLFTTILGYVLQDNERLRQNLVDSAIGTFPIIGAQLQSQTHTLEGSGAAAAIGAILLLYGAVGLGQAAQGAMNAVWNIPYVRRPSFVLRLLRAVGVLVLLALSTVGSTMLTGFATLATQGWPAKVFLLVGSFVLNFGLILVGLHDHDRSAAPLAGVGAGRGSGEPLLADSAGRRKLVCRPGNNPQQRHLRVLRRGHRAVVMDLPGRSAVPARGRDKRGSALPPLAQVDGATAADRRGPEGVRAPGSDGDSAAGGRAGRGLYPRGRSRSPRVPAGGGPRERPRRLPRHRLADG